MNGRSTQRWMQKPFAKQNEHNKHVREKKNIDHWNIHFNEILRQPLKHQEHHDHNYWKHCFMKYLNAAMQSRALDLVPIGVHVGLRSAIHLLAEMLHLRTRVETMICRQTIHSTTWRACVPQYGLATVFKTSTLESSHLICAYNRLSRWNNYCVNVCQRRRFNTLKLYVDAYSKGTPGSLTTGNSTITGGIPIDYSNQFPRRLRTRNVIIPFVFVMKIAHTKYYNTFDLIPEHAGQHIVM